MLGLSRWPLVVAPMAGGPTTIALVSAAAHARAVGFLAAGYKTAQGLTRDMADLRAAGVSTFGVNVFVPGLPATDRERVVAYCGISRRRGGRPRCGGREPRWDDDDCTGEALRCCSRPARRASLHLRHPGRGGHPLVAGSGLAGGADGLHAGGGPRRPCGPVPTRSACRAARRGPTGRAWPTTTAPTRTDPCAHCWRRFGVAPSSRSSPRGGVGGPADLVDLLARGASLVQAGTALLRCPESGAAQAQKDALVAAGFGTTAVTGLSAGDGPGPS